MDRALHWINRTLDRNVVTFGLSVCALRVEPLNRSACSSFSALMDRWMGPHSMHETRWRIEERGQCQMIRKGNVGRNVILSFVGLPLRSRTTIRPKKTSSSLLVDLNWPHSLSYSPVTSLFLFFFFVRSFFILEQDCCVSLSLSLSLSLTLLLPHLGLKQWNRTTGGRIPKFSFVHHRSVLNLLTT